MLARIVRDSETQQLTWQRITGDGGAAGATPLGSVLAYFGTTVPQGFLPCNGAIYDVTQYPELYEFLGTSTLPDLRECALVGIGENSTDTLGTHDIFTLGQFKDSGTYGTNTTSWEALHPYDATNNVMTTVINTTGAEQIVTAKTGTSTAALGMRTRSKGVNWIIKAVPGMETTEVTDAIEAINEKLARALVTKDVLALPTGADIEGYLYHYQGHYYVPHIDEESPTQSYLTELANLSDIKPVIEWLASTDPLPTGSAIEEHLYAQEYTTAGGDTKYHYYIGKVDTSDPLNNELVALETGAGASIFVGTMAEWNALSTAEKNEYQQANITDSNSVVNVPVDVVADGNMNPVTSNAASRDLILSINVATDNLATNAVYDKTYTGNNDEVVYAFLNELKQKADTNDQKISASGIINLNNFNSNYIINGTYSYIAVLVKGTSINRYFARMTLIPADIAPDTDMVTYTARLTQDGIYTIGGGIRWINATWGANSGHTGTLVNAGTVMNGYFTFNEGLRISPTNSVTDAWNEVVRVPGQLVHNCTLIGICSHSSRYYLDVRASNNNDNTWSVYFWGQPDTSAQYYFDLPSQAIPVLF